jgi:hypothetical protein
MGARDQVRKIKSGMTASQLRRVIIFNSLRANCLYSLGARRRNGNGNSRPDGREPRGHFFMCRRRFDRLSAGPAGC